jgi:DNA-binding transcriptional LysR family regulator
VKGLRLGHLQVLQSLASTGNLSESAAALNTTQPALSKRQKELEEDVGSPLFERHARLLRPTSYGDALIEHTRRIEAHLDIARDDMQALRAGSGLVSWGPRVYRRRTPCRSPYRDCSSACRGHRSGSSKAR